MAQAVGRTLAALFAAEGERKFIAIRKPAMMFFQVLE
jgi:hypothetical protein